MTIEVTDIVQAIMDSQRGHEPGTPKTITMRRALLDAGITEDEHHAFFQVIVGRGEYWTSKFNPQTMRPELITSAAFMDGLLIGIELNQQ